MKKEKKKSIILPRYNQEHPPGYELKNPWYMEFLPDGLITPEAVSGKKNLELFKTFTRVQKEVNASFEERVRDEFSNYYVEALADEEIIRCLPHKPVPIKWEDLTPQEKKDVVFLYKEDKSKGLVDSTIRKHIRGYFASKKKK